MVVKWMEWTRKTRLFNEITAMLRGVESCFEMGGQDQKSFLLTAKSLLEMSWAWNKYNFKEQSKDPHRMKGQDMLVKNNHARKS